MLFEIYFKYKQLFVLQFIKVRAENPESQLWDIGKVIGQMWRDAPETEKLAYQQVKS